MKRNPLPSNTTQSGVRTDSASQTLQTHARPTWTRKVQRPGSRDPTSSSLSEFSQDKEARAPYYTCCRPGDRHPLQGLRTQRAVGRTPRNHSVQRRSDDAGRNPVGGPKPFTPLHTGTVRLNARYYGRHPLLQGLGRYTCPRASRRALLSAAPGRAATIDLHSKMQDGCTKKKKHTSTALSKA